MSQFVQTVKLISSENESFELPARVAKQSGYLKDILEESEENEEITVPDVSSEALSKIVEYMIHFDAEEMKVLPKPLVSLDLKEATQEWYADFICLDDELLIKVILGANFMRIQPLLELSCAKQALVLRDKSPEYIRKFFNLPPEEEAAKST